MNAFKFNFEIIEKWELLDIRSRFDLHNDSSV